MSLQTLENLRTSLLLQFSLPPEESGRYFPRCQRLRRMGPWRGACLYGAAVLIAPACCVALHSETVTCLPCHAYRRAIWLGIMQERDDDILRFGLIGCLYFRQNKKLTVLYRFWGHLPSSNRILILANWAFAALAPGSTRCLAQNPYRTVDFLIYRALLITKADATRKRRVSARPQAGAWVPRLPKKGEDDRP